MPNVEKLCRRNVLANGKCPNQRSRFPSLEPTPFILNRLPIDFLVGRFCKKSFCPERGKGDALERAHFRFYTSIKVNKTPQKDPIDGQTDGREGDVTSDTLAFLFEAKPQNGYTGWGWWFGSGLG